MDKEKLSSAAVRFYDLVAKLRGPDGCPWDAKQDKVSMIKYLMGEAKEVVEAVEQNDHQHVCEELGDLLFHIVFLSSIYEGEQAFDLVDVIEQIERKMIGRHPHVFGDVKFKDAEEVSANWQRLKDNERKDK